MAYKGGAFFLSPDEYKMVEPYYDGLIPHVFIERLGILFCHAGDDGRPNLSLREIRAIQPKYISCCFPKRTQRHLKFVGVISSIVLFAQQYDEPMVMALFRYPDGSGELQVKSYTAWDSKYAVEWEEMGFDNP